MTKVDVLRQQVDQSAEATASESNHIVYEAPRVVHLGESSDIIRGNWTSGVWDYMQGSAQWYVSGE